MTARRTLAALLVAAPVLVSTACGDDAPTRAEFTDSVMDSPSGDEMVESLESAGIAADDARTIATDLIDCVYDVLSTDDEALNEAFEAGGDATMERILTSDDAKECADQLQAAVVEAAQAASSAGG